MTSVVTGKCPLYTESGRSYLTLGSVAVGSHLDVKNLADGLNYIWTVPFPCTANFVKHAAMCIDQKGKWNTVGAQHVLQFKLVIDIVRKCCLGFTEKNFSAVGVVVD